ncbi:hypothetical protein EP47_12320 [Legionella norrlandica]|uniref:PAS fold-4 domain-containing protein n=1 Tax=Legionella norrlandica TaxID=1498499 RepID=A0A0A2SRQ0_9GAMM|nr:PAS domain-containing protein [Legionella norrlandica]KGP63810.1 hypothetical protein EP47_12320 [Legionella norrlandica]
MMSVTSLLLKNLPGFVFVRDKNLYSQFCNPAYASYLGFKNPQEYIGINYEEVPNSYVAHFAELYDAHDRQVLESVKAIHILSIDNISHSKPFIMYGCKAPLLDDEGKLQGILGQALLLQDSYFGHLQELLKFKTKTTYEIDNYSKFGLSSREAECYFYLLRGLLPKP